MLERRQSLLGRVRVRVRVRVRDGWGSDETEVGFGRVGGRYLVGFG